MPSAERIRARVLHSDQVDEYRSGSDVTLEFADHRYRYARADFAARVVLAAVTLALTAESDRRGPEADDLVDLATTGTIAEPRSDLGRRTLAMSVEEVDRVVYWLRKLVFRSTWIDQRVRAGAIEADFDQARGAFVYRADSYELPVSADRSFPSFAERSLPS